MPSQIDHEKFLEVKRLSSIDIKKLFEQLSSSVNGLTSDQANEHREKYGSNKILVGAHESVVVKFLKLFFSPLSVLLLVLSLVSYLTGEPKGAIVILVIILLSTVLNTLQEHKSNNAVKKLKSLVI